MADKRQVKKNIKRLQSVKTWQLFVILILVGLLSATFLRLNNIGMVERRTAVFLADKRGDETVTRTSLFALQRYSAVHMNAGSGVIYLEDSYKRQVKKLVASAKDSDSVNKKALEEADASCRKQFPGYSQAYVQCNASEQAKFSGSSKLQSKLTFPNPELYRHDFASPLWSPDFAGWSLVLCGLITVVIISRLLGLLILRALLHKHYSSI